jgi:hypothetical protein
VQDKHFVSGSCAGVEREGFVLQSHNVGYEHEDCQKKHNNKAVDNDDGQKPILERPVDHAVTFTLVPA